jgi:hypothetical protein
MKYLGLLTLLAFAIFYSACNGSDSILGLGTIDSKITEQDGNAQNFDLPTPGYEMKVAIREDVE